MPAEIPDIFFFLEYSDTAMKSAAENIQTNTEKLSENAVAGICLYLDTYTETTGNVKKEIKPRAYKTIRVFWLSPIWAI
jgi:hypothetical protein